eukprot:XP_019927420.1 PREDICTED: uncharacterized protein LOC105339424 [Crassostrea gigas]
MTTCFRIFAIFSSVVNSYLIPVMEVAGFYLTPKRSENAVAGADSDCDILKMELTLRTLPRVLHKTQTVSCPRISLCHTRLFQNGVNEKSLVAARLSTKSDIVAERTLFQMLPVVYWQTDRHMAGHSKFSNIKHRKEAQDSKKSALMGQYVKLAQSAVKSK